MVYIITKPYWLCLSDEAGAMKRDSFKIQRKRLSDQIIESLVAMIADGELKPGDKLPPEPQLMDQFGVGRSSIREAIGALELIGLVTVRPGHGTHVTDSPDKVQSTSIGLSLVAIGHDKIRELVEARIELEQVIVRLAAERATKEDITEIKAQHKKLTASAKSGRKLIDSDLGFHIALATASHNSVLLRFLTELRQPMRHWMEQKAKTGRRYDQVIDQHETILNAIEARDPETAQSAMRIHLEMAGEKLISSILDIKSNS
jgi:GntR family transcriptional repressor for pyruvate dehydrogenase complex